MRRYGLLFRHRSHLGNEAIASSGNGFYMLLAAVDIAKGFSQHGDVMREVALLDGGIRPYRAHEDVLGDEGSVILHERSQRVEHLGPKLHWLPVSQQPTLLHLKAKRTKLVDLGVAFHRPHTGDSSVRHYPARNPAAPSSSSLPANPPDRSGATGGAAVDQRKAVVRDA